MRIKFTRHPHGPALHVYADGGCKPVLAYAYIDTHARHGCFYPQFAVMLPWGWTRSCADYLIPRTVSARITLPHVPWSWCMRLHYARPIVALNRLCQRAYFALHDRKECER